MHIYQDLSNASRTVTSSHPRLTSCVKCAYSLYSACVNSSGTIVKTNAHTSLKLTWIIHSAIHRQSQTFPDCENIQKVTQTSKCSFLFAMWCLFIVHLSYLKAYQARLQFFFPPKLPLQFWWKQNAIVLPNQCEFVCKLKEGPAKIFIVLQLLTSQK